VPAFSQDTADPDWPPRGEVDIGPGIAWSSSWDPWDGPPTDRAEAWSMSFRAVDGRRHEVSVTPRRSQAFRVEPGITYTYEITAVTDGATLRTGSAISDGDGLLTVEAIPVDASGVRLTISAPEP
jgi:hypothetical protein